MFVDINILSWTTHTHSPVLCHACFFTRPCCCFHGGSLSSQLTLHRLWPQMLLLLWLITQRLNTATLESSYRCFSVYSDWRDSSDAPQGLTSLWVHFTALLSSEVSVKYFIFVNFRLTFLNHILIWSLSEAWSKTLFACELVQVNRWMFWFLLLPVE